MLYHCIKSNMSPGNRYWFILQESLPQTPQRPLLMSASKTPKLHSSCSAWPKYCVKPCKHHRILGTVLTACKMLMRGCVHMLHQVPVLLRLLCIGCHMLWHSQLYAMFQLPGKKKLHFCSDCCLNHHNTSSDNMETVA